MHHIKVWTFYDDGRYARVLCLKHESLALLIIDTFQCDFVVDEHGGDLPIFYAGLLGEKHEIAIVDVCANHTVAACVKAEVCVKGRGHFDLYAVAGIEDWFSASDAAENGKVFCFKFDGFGW